MLNRLSLTTSAIKGSVILLTLALAFLSTTSRSAWAIQADGGYEGIRLPGDAGWVEYGASFLDDYVTVSNGIMTYYGPADPPPGTCGMQLPAWPFTGTTGTIEYRVRCRALGAPGEAHRYFSSWVFYGTFGTFSVADVLGKRYGVDVVALRPLTQRKPCKQASQLYLETGSPTNG